MPDEMRTQPRTNAEIVRDRREMAKLDQETAFAREIIACYSKEDCAEVWRSYVEKNHVGRMAAHLLKKRASYPRALASLLEPDELVWLMGETGE